MSKKIRRIGKDTKEDRMLKELFVSPIREGFLEIGEEKYVLPRYFEEHHEEINKFEVQDDDIFVTGHPRTGSTWLFEMINLIIADFNYDAVKVNLIERWYMLEAVSLFDTKQLPGQTDLLTRLNEIPSPRCIKTHLIWSLLPEQIRNGTKKPKIIHVIRDPRDVCISFYHHAKLTDGYRGGLEDFCRLFMAGKLIFGPFFPTILSYWRERERPNVLFVKYSDMKRDLPSVIKRIATFLGKSFTEDQIEKATQYLSFESMKKNPSLDMQPLVENFFKSYGLTAEEGNFFRVGKEGSYKSEMSPELADKFDAWTEKQLSGTGLNF